MGATMMRVPISVCHLMLAAMVLTGCAAQAPAPVRGPNAYTVVFSVTRSSDHAAIATVSLPVGLGSEAKLTKRTTAPGENQPVAPGFLVRLNRTRQPGVFELVTRVSVREAIRNKKGKLKFSKRFIGALVPTRPGETQVVSVEGDPIHVEARLEHQ